MLICFPEPVIMKVLANIIPEKAGWLMKRTGKGLLQVVLRSSYNEIIAPGPLAPCFFELAKDPHGLTQKIVKI
jgi:hypothetical protein